MAQPVLQNILDALESAVTQSGETLAARSLASPVMLLFLRHAGCTFCREALSDVARSRTAIERTGARIVLVYMGDTEPFLKQLARYGLAGVDRICDPDRNLYRALGLKRGKLWQLFGPKVVWRAFEAAILSRHGTGRVSADSFQMPGLFVIENARIVQRFRHRTAADRPDYAAICATAVKTRL